MSVRKIESFNGETADAKEIRVVVKYDSDLAEYRGCVWIAGARYLPADYFTNDKADALDTARAMFHIAFRLLESEPAALAAQIR